MEVDDLIDFSGDDDNTLVCVRVELPTGGQAQLGSILFLQLTDIGAPSTDQSSSSIVGDQDLQTGTRFYEDMEQNNK